MTLSKYIFIISLSFVLLTSSLKQAHACSCANPGLPEANYESAEAVFMAEITDVSTSTEFSYLKQYHFNVKKTWKGDVKPNFIHSDPRHNCAYRQFNEGDRYLIYASKPWNADESANEYEITFCSRTKNAKNAQIEMRYLDFIQDGKEIAAIQKTLIAGLSQNNDEDFIVESLRLIRELIAKEDFDQTGLVHALNKLKEHSNYLVRKEVSQLFGNRYIQDKTRSVSHLKDLISDPDSNVRMSAVFGFKTNSAKDSEAYQILKSALQNEVKHHTGIKSDKYWQNISAILTALYEISPDEVYQEVLELLLQNIPHLSDYAKVGPIQRIGFMGEKAKSAAPFLISELKNDDGKNYQIRQYIIMSLGMIKADGAEHIIAPYVDDSNCYVSKETATALNKINSDAGNKIIKDTIIPALIKGFDRCTYEYAQAFSELGHHGKPALSIIQKKYYQDGEPDWVKTYLKQAINAIEMSKD